jgi:hypothetical protein
MVIFAKLATPWVGNNLSHALASVAIRFQAIGQILWFAKP